MKCKREELRVTAVEYILGSDWKITSAGGSTGTAYYAQSNQQKLFLKRNSSPFLAVLSAQGIVPKLVWTKRLENGDVVTAQRWLDGKALNMEEMQHHKVAKLLSKIHHSSELLDMLLRIEKTSIDPKRSLWRLKQIVQENRNARNSLSFYKAIKFLENKLLDMLDVKQTVCHCDLNRHNWMLSDEGELYLIDWDSARIGDPAMDIGRILQSYIPVNEWDQWLELYGMEKNTHLLQRMHWYLLMDEMTSFIKYDNSQQTNKAAYHMEEVNQLLHQVRDWNL